MCVAHYQLAAALPAASWYWAVAGHFAGEVQVLGLPSVAAAVAEFCNDLNVECFK